MNAARKAAIAAAAGVVLASAGLLTQIRGHEGRELKPYRDIAGVLTVCDGITGPDVQPGKTYTDAECNALSLKHVEAHGAKLLQCIQVRVTQGYYDALASWAYNVGVGAACGSTLVRLLNAGEYRAACDQLLRWNRAGGKVVRGLTNRRMAERAQCLQSIPQPPKGLA
jgi:GH24 family phage-related lysozyme (muramidase)